MNGAESLVHTLADSGIEICFGNPGTSEMHFVAALDREPRMRGVLCLFEGVVAGAADGYARMTGKPAATLLHLGPGFANAISFLHNARKAGQPVVNIVGDHATSHAQICPGAADLRHHGDLRLGVGLAASKPRRRTRWRAMAPAACRRRGAGTDRDLGAAGRLRLERSGGARQAAAGGAAEHGGQRGDRPGRRRAEERQEDARC